MKELTQEKVEHLLLYPMLQTGISGPFLNLLICPIDEGKKKLIDRIGRRLHLNRNQSKNAQYPLNSFLQITSLMLGYVDFQDCQGY